MRAVVIKTYGSPDVLEVKEAPTPEPGPQEILVEVFACGLNPVDFKLRSGHLKDLFPMTFPRILGGDISGVVRKVGQGATNFSVGDEVFFSNPLDKNGGYAEFCVVNQSIVARKPPSLSHIEAASLPVAGLTSIQALRDFGRIKAGSKVLIHAGAGGVGSFAIQYAKSMNATVFTTASTQKAEYVRSLGADRVIDYRNEDFVEVCEREGGMDIVLEAIGGPTYAKSILATRQGGAVPCVVNPPDSDTKQLSEKHGIKTGFFLLTGKRSDLEEIRSLIENGSIRTTVSKVLLLNEARSGHEQLESGRTQGKIVLRVKGA